MLKIVSVLALLALATLASAKVRTNLTVVHPGIAQKLNGEHKLVETLKDLPDDDGWSNWGDLIYKDRQNNDVLLLRDLVIYPVTSTRQQTLQYTAYFDNANQITSVRFVNVGRERAFGDEIDIASNGAQIFFVLPEQRDPRVIIEIYGYDN